MGERFVAEGSFRVKLLNKLHLNQYNYKNG